MKNEQTLRGTIIWVNKLQTKFDNFKILECGMVTDSEENRTFTEHELQFMGRNAENVHTLVAIGQRMEVIGSIHVTEYEKGGVLFEKTIIIVREFRTLPNTICDHNESRLTGIITCIEEENTNMFGEKGELEIELTTSECKNRCLEVIHHSIHFEGLEAERAFSEFETGDIIEIVGELRVYRDTEGPLEFSSIKASQYTLLGKTILFKESASQFGDEKRNVFESDQTRITSEAL